MNYKIKKSTGHYTEIEEGDVVKLLVDLPSYKAGSFLVLTPGGFVGNSNNFGVYQFMPYDDFVKREHLELVNKPNITAKIFPIEVKLSLENENDLRVFCARLNIPISELDSPLDYPALADEHKNEYKLWDELNTIINEEL